MIGVALARRYEIPYELEHGGMAIVYAATDRPTSELVAVKVMRPELAVALSAKRFTREVRVTAKLRHPGIVPLLDAGVAEAVLRPSTQSINGATSTRSLACCTKCWRVFHPTPVRPHRQCAPVMHAMSCPACKPCGPLETVRQTGTDAGPFAVVVPQNAREVIPP